MNSDIRFGIVQGRLTQSPPGCLQWFPQEHWENEFALAKQVGISYIELIAEVQHNPDNPLWSDKGIEKINALVAENGLTGHALCNDFVVENSLIADPAVLQQNISLINRGYLLNMEKYVLPLFDASEMTAENTKDFLGPVGEIADEAHKAGMITCLETILSGPELCEFLNALDRPYVQAVYDTGNRAASGLDLANDIRELGDRICHVHIKDKNKDNQNVPLGTGLVNFSDVFDAFRDIGYDGPYTFESQRGEDPVRTAQTNIDFVTVFLENARSSTAL